MVVDCGGVPSDYLVSTQLQLWLFCCWGCGCCWAVTITRNWQYPQFGPNFLLIPDRVSKIESALLHFRFIWTLVWVKSHFLPYLVLELFLEGQADFLIELDLRTNLRHFLLAWLVFCCVFSCFVRVFVVPDIHCLFMRCELYVKWQRIRCTPKYFRDHLLKLYWFTSRI